MLQNPQKGKWTQNFTAAVYAQEGCIFVVGFSLALTARNDKLLKV